MAGGETVVDSKYANAYERGRLRVIESLIPSGGQEALDVGCGSGLISEMMSERGWAVTAVDLDYGNVQRARPRACSAIQGEAASVCRGFEPGQFEFICALEIIEHVTEVEGDELLQQCRRIAAPDAHMLLSTPNRMSPEGLYGYYYLERIRGHKFNAWDADHEHVYSSVEVLRKLQMAGWQPEKIVGYYYGGVVSLPITSAEVFPLNMLGFNTLILNRAA